MFRKYRSSLHLLLGAAVLFLQITLAFHHHGADEDIQCESQCKISHHGEQAHDESCQYTIFYFANLAGDPLSLVAKLQLPAPVWQELPDVALLPHQTIYFNWNSRAPPIL